MTPLLVLGRRIPGEGVWGSVITSQAWAPDNRRLVFMNDDGHVIVLDTVTGTQRDLGVGTEPTWAPMGDEIAVQLPRPRGGPDADYVLIPVDRPDERRLLLANPRPRPWRPQWLVSGYYGPALWSPDGQYLALRRLYGETPYPYLLERSTGRIERLPDWFTGDTWGGKP
jgi:hypothetical protein